MRRVTDAMFLDAARALADIMSPADLDQGRSTARSRASESAHMLLRVRNPSRRCPRPRVPAILAGLEETVRRAMLFPEYRPIRYQRDKRSAA